MKPSRVSLVIPVFNEQANLPELIQRCVKVGQALPNDFEVVFVDDRSTDHTGALIDELAARYSFVRPVHHTVNQGIPGGWASGVQAATGRYVAIMDGDLDDVAAARVETLLEQGGALAHDEPVTAEMQVEVDDRAAEAPLPRRQVEPARAQPHPLGEHRGRAVGRTGPADPAQQCSDELAEDHP